MVTCSVRYRKSKIRGQKHPREVVENRNNIPKIVNIRYRTSSAQEGQATTGHPFLHQQTHNYMLRPISRIQIHSYINVYIYIYIYIYTLVQTIISVRAILVKEVSGDLREWQFEYWPALLQHNIDDKLKLIPIDDCILSNAGIRSSKLFAGKDHMLAAWLFWWLLSYLCSPCKKKSEGHGS